MAKRQIHLSKEQVKEVKRYEQQSKRPVELKRLQAVRLYGTGHKLADILEIVGCGESSVRIWAMQYCEGGVEALLANYKPSSQNARKLSREDEQDLCEKLAQYRPAQVMSEDECYGTGEFWTVEDLRSVLMRWYQVSYRHASSNRKLFHRCGFS
jgi:transposase